MKKPYADQISDTQQVLAGKQAEMDAVMAKSSDEGRTLTTDEAARFDALEVERADLVKHLDRLRVLETAQAAAAVAPASPTGGANALAPRPAIHLVGPTLDKGIAFTRYVMCLASARGNITSALEIAKSRYPDHPQISLVLKAAVSAGTTTDPTWAGALVDYRNLADDFIEFLRPQTIIGRIPNLTRVPFMVRLVGQTSGGDAWWVGQGAPKPLTKFDFAPVTLEFSKVANIAVLTEELVRFSSPNAEMLVRKALAAAIIERIDTDFIDPDKAAVANVSPASITNSVAAIPSSGNDAAAVRADLQALLAPFIAANGRADGLVFIMSQTTALSLAMMFNPLGQPEFAGMGMTGGTLMGIPVITSQYAALGSPVNNLVVLANAPDIYLADDGQVVIDASREASLEMDSAPTNHSGTPTHANLVSLWQTNSIGLRAERFINWKKVRPEAVQYLEDVAWGAPA